MVVYFIPKNLEVFCCKCHAQGAKCKTVNVKKAEFNALVLIASLCKLESVPVRLLLCNWSLKMMICRPSNWPNIFLQHFSRFIRGLQNEKIFWSQALEFQRYTSYWENGKNLGKIHTSITSYYYARFNFCFASLHSSRLNPSIASHYLSMCKAWVNVISV